VRSLILLFLLSILGAEAQNKYAKDIEAFERADQANPPPRDAVLFVGSSSIRMWKTLSEDFPDAAVINRGFGGSEISDQLQFFDRIVPVYKPRKIVMFCGENDVWRDKSPEQVYADFRTFVNRVDKTLPGVPIGFIELKPSPKRISKWPAYQKCNGLIRAYCKDQPLLEYFDVAIDMLDDEGGVRKEIFDKDMLHLNADGYALWTKHIQAWVNAPP